MQKDQDDNNNPASSKDSFKIKLAMFFGYNGEHYNGLQWQNDPNVKTVENTFHQTLCELGFVLGTNSSQLKKIKWSRAARTDKRVHALCNAIACKLEVSKKYLKTELQLSNAGVLNKGECKSNIDYERIVMDINAALPRDIRLYSLKNVTKKFDMRHDATYRLYNYILPVFVFQSHEDIKANKPISKEQAEAVVEDLSVKIKNYLKTHNFHNFSKGMKETDPRSQRFILEMGVQLLGQNVVQQYLVSKSRDPHTQFANTNKQYFLRFRLLGQSFVYHQIRKMIGLLVQIHVQKLDPATIFTTAFGPQKMAVFLAPGEGLYLNQMRFDIYNKKLDTPQKLLFDQGEVKKMEEFRAELQQIILGHEFEESVFTNWVSNYYDKTWNEFSKEDEESPEPESDKE